MVNKVIKVRFKLKKTEIVQISLSILTFVLTVLLPIIGYFQFKIAMPSDTYLSEFQENYDIVFIGTVMIGVLLTGLRYYLYKFPQYSLRRGIISLLNSILIMIFLIITSQIGNLDIKIENSSLYLNLTGVFILLIGIWSLFIFKNIYDLVDFKLNQNYYKTFARERKFKKEIRSRPLIKCPKCKYMCRPEWKQCTICNTKIGKRV